MHVRLLPLAAAGALAGAAVGGCGGGSGHEAPVRPLGPLPAHPGPCRGGPAPRPRAEGHLRRPELRLPRNVRLDATMRTACGTIVIALDTRTQPRTAASFAYLARRGFYDRLSFDKVIREPGGGPFIVGGGDPLGAGRGGPGYRIVEPPPEDVRYLRGTVVMFRRVSQERGASGSQFFIVTAPRLVLPADYAVLGHVTSGADALARIAARPSDPKSGLMLRPVTIERVTISGG